jgi:Family of unknown function (DUF6527)
MRVAAFRPVVVDIVPDRLDEGVLYISLKYKTALHKCACGCGNEVVTPLGPTDWRLSEASGRISLWPSVGSWNLPCRSHYWIRQDAVAWDVPWSDDKIAAARTRERETKQRHFAAKAREGLWQRLWRWLSG